MSIEIGGLAKKIMNKISKYKNVVGQDDIIHRFLLFFHFQLF
jgi:hypothetical protein